MQPRGVWWRDQPILQQLQHFMSVSASPRVVEGTPSFRYKPPTAGTLTLEKLKKMQMVGSLALGLIRGNALTLFPTLLNLQDYVITQAPQAAVNNQQIHQSPVVNDPNYISGQFTF